MKIKVSELEGAQLDYWVGVAEGLLVEIKRGACFRETSFGKHEYRPSSDWSQGGPIIENGRFTMWTADDKKTWKVRRFPGVGWEYKGVTLLIAAMRCWVASKFGEEVEE